MSKENRYESEDLFPVLRHIPDRKQRAMASLAFGLGDDHCYEPYQIAIITQSSLDEVQQGVTAAIQHIRAAGLQLMADEFTGMWLGERT